MNRARRSGLGGWKSEIRREKRGKNLDVNISVVIPACNEARAIGKVVGAVPAGRVREIVVVDNGSTDDTYQVCEEYAQKCDS